MLLPNRLLQLSQSFYDQDEKRQAEILSEFLEFANENRAVVDNLIPKANEEELETVSLFLEALAIDANNWAEYFLSVPDQLVTRAQGLKKPGDVLMYITDLIYLGRQPFIYRSKIAKKIILLLSHSHPTFRWYALILLADFMEENSFEYINQIYPLLQDTNWKIRHWADFILKDVDASYQSKLSLLDRLRSKLFISKSNFD